LAEIDRLLNENLEQSSETRTRRLEEIRRIFEEFELEKQKKIEWVDYAEQPSIAQESPSPVADPNLTAKIQDDTELISLETPPESLRKEPERPSESMRPSIFEM
jgi:hypothetical protein